MSYANDTCRNCNPVSLFLGIKYNEFMGGILNHCLTFKIQEQSLKLRHQVCKVHPKFVIQFYWSNIEICHWCIFE
jgi:hypothetical protein